MKILQNIIKLFAFIIIIKASFLVSFAFLWDDLWLDIYKNIDSGVIKLDSTMYSHELKWWDIDWDITENINEKIKRAGLESCELENITEEDIENIAYWEKDNVEKSPNIWLLSKKIKWEKCDNSIETLNKLQLIVYNTAMQSSESAKSKAKDIYNISKVWLFSDWNVQNSPFDLVQDIKDIDYIIFTQDVKYQWDISVWDDLVDKYLKWKKLWKFLKWDLLDEIYKNSEDKANQAADKIENEVNRVADKVKNLINWNNTENNWYITTSWDNTRISCPVWEDESWLSKEDLNNIINSSKNWWNNLWNDNWNKWPINKNYRERKPLSDNPFSFSTSSSNNWTGNYKEVNDNDFFGWCDKFFCINVEYLTHDWNLLIGWKTRSIESIVERSNNHLKKFANSSLVQSKMTKNLFELWLRDIDLSSMFSMPIVIIKKTPPILNLDFFNNKVASEKKKNNSNPLSRQNLLKSRFDAVWINIERENDLSIFEDRDAEIKTVINNAELWLSQVQKNEIIRREEKSKMLLLDAHVSRIINANYQSGDTEWLYKEFVELEKFSSEIQNYVNAWAKSADKMLTIPIHQ